MLRTIPLPTRLLWMLALVACASDAPVEPDRKVDTRDIWRSLGCAPDEVAYCVGNDCKPEDYVCTDREELRNVFGPHNRP